MQGDAHVDPHGLPSVTSAIVHTPGIPLTSPYKTPLYELPLRILDQKP